MTNATVGSRSYFGKPENGSCAAGETLLNSVHGACFRA